MKIILTKPLEYEGKNYTELDLDLENLTGKQMIAAELEARIDGDRTVLIEASKNFQACIAAAAAGVPVELMKALSLKDFGKVTGAVQLFLFE